MVGFVVVQTGEVLTIFDLLVAYRQPLTYIGVGGCGVVVDLLVFFVFQSFSVDHLIANIVSIATAAGVTFFLHSFYTFRARPTIRLALRYCAVVTLGMIFATAVLAVLYALAVPIGPAKFISTAGTICMQFFVNQNNVFVSVRD